MMLADGRLVTVDEHGCDDPAIDAALRQLVDEHHTLFDNELGHFARQSSGYGLHHLATSPVKAIAGSEGNLGIITEATVRLVELPSAKALAVLAFDTVFDAARAGAQLRAHPGIATIEGMGGDLVDALGTDHRGGGGGRGGDPGGRGEADRHGPGRDARAVADPGGGGHRHAAPRRRRGLAQLGGLRRPAGESGRYLQDLYELMERHGLRGIPFGEGCVHVRLSFDFDSEEGRRTFRRFMRDAALLVTSHGGSLSGEHGDGRARSSLLRAMYSPALRDVFEEFKLIFDPDRIFNPGVLVWAENFAEGLRIGRGSGATRSGRCTAWSPTGVRWSTR